MNEVSILHDGPSFAMKLSTGAFNVEPTIFSSEKNTTLARYEGFKICYTMLLYGLPSSELQREQKRGNPSTDNCTVLLGNRIFAYPLCVISHYNVLL
jgi:hypothetical protein